MMEKLIDILQANLSVEEFKIVYLTLFVREILLTVSIFMPLGLLVVFWINLFKGNIPDLSRWNKVHWYAVLILYTFMIWIPVANIWSDIVKLINLIASNLSDKFMIFTEVKWLPKTFLGILIIVAYITGLATQKLIPPFKKSENNEHDF